MKGDGMSNVVRKLSWAAGCGWLVAVGSLVRSAVVHDGDDWELAYIVFSAAAVFAVVLTLVVAAAVSRDTGRPGLRVAGLAVGAVGAVLALIATWAIPVWLVPVGLGVLLLAVAATSRAAPSAHPRSFEV